MQNITYASSGVDIHAAELATNRIAEIAAKTFNSSVLTNIGLFAGAYSIGNGKILLSSADGVGTKTIVAALAEKYDTVGIDLVHHCGNDIIVHNAEPLFFLDYIGHSDLTEEKIGKIALGLVRGCMNIGVALIGGETAQMPGIYPDGRFDLVGFIVGCADADDMITGSKITPGDVIIALPSNGLHTNGYSLARKVLFDVAKFSVGTYIDELGETIADALLRTHTSYINQVRTLRKSVDIKGMAHITGGGVTGNLIRILPKNCVAKVVKKSSPKPAIFTLIEKVGKIDDDEMFRTFNMGFGFILVISRKECDSAMAILGKDAFIAGEITAGEKRVELV